METASYAVVGLRLGRRLLLHVNVTADPMAEWVARQITETCAWDQAPGCLIRDRDAVYGQVFTRRLRAMGIRDRPTAPRSPWQNGCVERLIGSIRRDCLDHIIVVGERHLRRILSEYASYDNEARTHLALEKDAPVGRKATPSGTIRTTPFLGGLHHQYVRTG